jgi:hypothetical protein
MVVTKQKSSSEKLNREMHKKVMWFDLCFCSLEWEQMAHCLMGSAPLMASLTQQQLK